jgi:hypothetical protein
MHDAQLFDRIHVIPRTKDLALLLSDQQVLVEIWNARRDRCAVMASVAVVGPSGVTVDAVTLPHHMAATEDETFIVRATQTGDPRLADVVTWTFAGQASNTTDLTLTGKRLVPLPFMAEASVGIVERISFLTNVITAHDGSEQRVQLRANPRRMIEMTLAGMTPTEAQHLSAILYGWQSRVYGVPLWMYSEPLTAMAGSGGTSLSLDTTGVPWAQGSIAYLWTDPWTWSAMTVDAVSAGGLTLTAPLNSSWPSGTRVVPMISGRLAQQVSLSWLSRDCAEARLQFKEIGAYA